MTTNIRHVDTFASIKTQVMEKPQKYANLLNNLLSYKQATKRKAKPIPDKHEDDKDSFRTDSDMDDFDYNEPAQPLPILKLPAQKQALVGNAGLAQAAVTHAEQYFANNMGRPQPKNQAVNQQAAQVALNSAN